MHCQTLSGSTTWLVTGCRRAGANDGLLPVGTEQVEDLDGVPRPATAGGRLVAGSDQQCARHLQARDAAPGPSVGRPRRPGANEPPRAIRGDAAPLIERRP